MGKSDEILAEIRKLNVKLYGENGFEGDIPEIKKRLKAQNGRQGKTERRLNILIGILIGCGVIVGGTTGMVNLIR